MNIYLYILVMAVVTYLIRMLPLTLIKEKIENKFLQSFLYYIPYACLMATKRKCAVSARWRSRPKRLFRSLKPITTTDGG